MLTDDILNCAEYWGLSYKLFNTTQETFPVPFIAGDIFDPSFLEPAAPSYAPPSTHTPVLSEVKTLTELRGHVSRLLQLLGAGAVVTSRG